MKKWIKDKLSLSYHERNTLSNGRQMFGAWFIFGVDNKRAVPHSSFFWTCLPAEGKSLISGLGRNVSEITANI